MSDDSLRPVYGRPPAAVKAAAVRVLAEAGEEWTMDAFLVACLVALGTKPAEILKLVAPYRLEPRPPGRPRKSKAEAEPVGEKPEPKKAARKPASTKPAPVERVQFVPPKPPPVEWENVEIAPGRWQRVRKRP